MLFVRLVFVCIFVHLAQGFNVDREYLDNVASHTRIRRQFSFGRQNNFDFQFPDDNINQFSNENNRVAQTQVRQQNFGFGGQSNSNPNSNVNGFFDFNNNGNSNNRVTQRPPWTTTTVRIPGMGSAPSACEVACPTTSQYSPVCGTDNVTYANMGRLQCAQKCGKRVSVMRPLACPRF